MTDNLMLLLVATNALDLTFRSSGITDRFPTENACVVHGSLKNANVFGSFIHEHKNELLCSIKQFSGVTENGEGACSLANIVHDR
jgi:hypothetical protein